ncbi:MAG: PAS domain S-box protein, partial [Candidatus Thermoplasmatota archaeon]
MPKSKNTFLNSLKDKLFNKTDDFEANSKPDIVRELRKEEKLGLLNSNFDSPAGNIIIKDDMPEKDVKNSSTMCSKERDGIFSMVDNGPVELIFESTPFPMVFKRKDGVYAVVNESFCRFIDKSKEEIIGSTDFELFPSDKAKKYVKADREILKTDESRTKLEKVTGDEKRWLKVSKTPVKKNGEIIGILCSFSDLTEDKKLLAELEKSEKKYPNLFEEAGDGIIVHDLEGNILDVNNKLCEIFGCTKEEFQNMNILEDQPYSADKERQRRIFDKLLREGQSKFEADFVTKSGKIITGEVSSSVLKRGDERWVQAIFRDVTERKKTEKKLQESEEKYRGLFNSALFGISVHDSDGNIIAANDKAEEIFGISEKHLKKKDLDFWVGKLLRPSGEPMKPSEFPLAIVSKKKSPSEGKVIGLKMSKDEGIRWFLHSARPVLNDKGNIEKVITSFVDITERKKAKKEMKEIKERYEALFKRSMDAVYIHDLNGNFMDANQAALDLLGYDRDDLDNLKFSDLLVKNHLKKAFMTLKEVLKTGSQDKLTRFRLKTKDGEEILLETKSSLIYKEGEPYAILGIGRDITLREEILEHLRKSEKKYRQLAETTAAGILVADRAGKLIYVNPALEEMFGIPFSESAGTSFRKYLSKKSYLKAMKLLKNLKRGESFKRIELRATHKDRDDFPIEVSASPMIEDDKFKGFVCVVEDVTEIREQEKKLKESESRFRKLFAQSNDAIFIHNIDGEILDVNHRVLEMLGYSKDEILDKNITSLHPKDEISKSKHAFKKTIKEGGVLFESRLIRKDGSEVLVDISSGIIDEEKGIIQGIVRDITDRKKTQEKIREAKEKLEDLNENLEKKVEERTKRIKSLLRQKDDFVNQLGHDLKNPLTPLVTLLPVIKKKVDDEKLLKVLEVLEKNTDYMKNLVKKTIELAKLNSSKIDFDF